MTCSPRAAKMAAYSMPMIPAPRTIMLRGMRVRRRIVSLSKTVFSSNGTSTGWEGREPVAMTITSPVRCVRHCPSYLNPSRLSVLGEAFLDGDLDAVNAAKDIGLMDCILCGSCAYVCPARRRIVHLVETLRAERRKTLAREREKERAAAAKLKAEAEKVAH